jgi:hypothetical protein
MRAITSGFADAKNIEEALYLFEQFYHILGLSDPWSENAYVICECSNCKKDGVCHHSSGISLLCDDNVLMPPEYYLHGVPMKRKRGRPSSVKDRKEEEEEAEVPRKKPPVICFSYYHDT